METKLKTKRGLYAIVDDGAHTAYGFTRLLHKITFESEIPIVQLRLKNLSPMEKFKWIETAIQLKNFRDFTLIVNDDISTLSLSGVDGVHLGQDDGDFQKIREQFPNKILGLSTHNLNEAQAAVDWHADYIGCGCLFPTNTKSQTQKLEFETLKTIVKKTSLPKVAIGGITLENLDEALKMNCEFYAVASGLVYNGEFVGQHIQEKIMKY